MTAPKPLPKPEVVPDVDLLSAVEEDAVYEVPSADALSDGASDAPSGDSSAGVVLPSDFAGFSEVCMQHMSMQTALLSFLLLAVLLSFGASLWLSFSDKWRS